MLGDRAGISMPAYVATFASGPPMFFPGLGTIPGPPTRLWSHEHPESLWLVDDRRAGLEEEHRGVRVIFVSIGEALAMLAPPPLSVVTAPLSTADVAARFGIARSTLETLIRRLPPEEVGAALVVNDPRARNVHRRWHADKVDDWFQAVHRLPRETSPVAVRRPAPPSTPGEAVDWNAVPRQLQSEGATNRRKRAATGKLG